MKPVASLLVSADHGDRRGRPDGGTHRPGGGGGPQPGLPEGRQAEDLC